MTVPAGPARAGSSPAGPARAGSPPAVLAEAAERELAAGNLEAAIDGAQALLDLDPGDGRAYALLGVIAHRVGDDAAALDLLGRALACAPDSSPVRRHAAAVLLDLGRVDDAAAQLRAAGSTVIEGPLRPVRAWCEDAGAPSRIVRPARPARIARPRYAGDAAAPEPLVTELPERSTATIPDAVVIGGESLVVTADGTILSDVATHPEADRQDLIRGAVRAADARSALLDVVGGPARTIEAGILLTGPAGGNYYHWLLEHLTRLETIEAGGDTISGPLIVDAGATRTPQLMASLARAAGSGREVIALRPRETLRVRSLTVASPGAWIVFDLRDGLQLEPRDSLVDPASVAYLRDRLMPAAVRQSGPGTRRLFLARSRVARLRNATDLWPVLRALGFEAVLPEAMSFAEQVELFAAADVVVAESGAALANIVFAPSTARVVVLSAGRWDLTLFSQLAGIRGQDMVYVAGEAIPGSHPKAYQVRFTLDPAVLRAAMVGLPGTPL